MEPTPELKAIIRVLGIDTVEDIFDRGVSDEAVEQAFIAHAQELRAALLPFERAAELSEAKRAAVERGQQLIEARRQADEQAAQSIGAGKPVYVPKQGLWERLRAWIGRKV